MLNAGAPCGAAAGASAKVQVRFCEGVKTIFTIDVDPGVTILDLKNKVCDRTALKVDSFKLALRRPIALSDQDTLNSLALKFGTKDFDFEIKQQGLLGGMVCLLDPAPQTTRHADITHSGHGTQT